ncbi:MAG: N-acetylmuramoyl-L-alanine amidase [Bacteroidales bacterium]|nr:N-acetylmuramoyl-L-alanine amidase [Bacteroidales bacterium]MDP2236939.1 N-acetylmuramoyl-L-alanine amidase [Bacteroidales bacterium]
MLTHQLKSASFRQSLFISIVILFFYFQSAAQNIEKTLISGDTKKVTLRYEKPVNAVVIRGEKRDLEQLQICANGKIFNIGIDEHIDSNDTIFQSNLIFFDNAADSIHLSNLQPDKSLEMILIRVPAISRNSRKNSSVSNCEEPPIVLQEVWRAGLPEPDYIRIRTEVKNIIIHHSATSNSITDYTGLVRSIYTTHTQVNNYSDIGYNYLIAPDGTIFAGRDPGQDIEQDAVLGAHFCASNTGTLGICILGNFMNVPTTEQAITSLNHLLAWKTAKDSLSPFGKNFHPLNPELGIIAGHRNGCATLCPGDILFNQLHPIKENCNHQLESCGVFLSLPNNPIQDDFSIFPNPSSEAMVFIQLPVSMVGQGKTIQIQFIDLHGRVLMDRTYPISENQISIEAPTQAGIYFVYFRQGVRQQIFKYLRLK